MTIYFLHDSSVIHVCVFKLAIYLTEFWAHSKKHQSFLWAFIVDRRSQHGQAWLSANN